jgi:hypothetical protein
VIETRTTWEDTGYDCDHCGGRILKRTDFESGQPERSCFQCELCSCQWTLTHKPLRIGTRRACRQAQRERAAESETIDPYSRWVLLGLGILAALILFRIGGVGVIRFVLPVIIAGGLLFGLTRFGRTQGWW